MRDLIIWGAAGHAKVLREAADDFRLVAVFDNDSTRPAPFHDVPIFYGASGFDEWRSRATSDAMSAVAIGGERGGDRLEILKMLEQAGFPPATLVHRAAFVAPDVVLGSGSHVLARAVIGVGTRVGRGCIINTAASVDHECRIGDGVHIAPGAVLTGNVTVGARSFVGAGAVILPRIHIGEEAIVGAGAVVTRDVPNGVTVIGVPARTRQ